ncbi:MAG: isoprenylcysteine carboxylmethyltransferase family protein [Fimbriimonadia bacterium]|nr:isoprenylcysteine carboxylmethyltransferase family protein [Fimbriimonadia bacterium]
MGWLWVGVQVALFAGWGAALGWTPAADWGLARWGGLPLLLASAFFLMPSLIAHGRKLTPLPKPNRALGLQRHGVYASIRHPMYLGLMLMVYGVALLLQKPYGLLGATAIMLFFHLKAREEERQLVQVYPDYAAYQQQTGRFLPRWRARKN